MPKSSKHKKEKAVDFAKAKLKLGKGKQVASNVVDTSFKARSIALPSQSIVAEKDAETPTTKRKLTFDDLTSHLKHYNTGTRKDALLGLRELLESYPALLRSHLTPLVNSCVRIVADEDASVRKALLAFFDWLFRQIPPEDLVPHSPVLLLFTTSAQTHIFPEIRIDAIRFLDLFLEYIPGVVVEGWKRPGGGHGRRVLEGYLGILSAGTIFGQEGDSGPVRATSTASVVLSPASKLAVLKSLSSFLSHAVASPSGQSLQSSSAAGTSLQTPTWYLATSFSSPGAFESFEGILRPTLVEGASSSAAKAFLWTEEVNPDANSEDFPGAFDFLHTAVGSGWTFQDLADAQSQIGAQTDKGESNAVAEQVIHVAHALHPTLVSTFLDSSPAVFSPSASPTGIELQTIFNVVEIYCTLYGFVLKEATPSNRGYYAAVEELKTILGYLSPYFPFGTSFSTVVKRDIKLEQAFQDLNQVFCELTSFLVLASPDAGTASRTSSRSRGKQRAATVPTTASAPLQLTRVSEYVVGLLRGEPSSGLSRAITPTAYIALLPSIWALVSASGEPDAAGEVLGAVVEHAAKISSGSAAKRHTVDFLARLVLLEQEAEYRGACRVGATAGSEKRVAEWLLHLPKTLWELGAGQPALTETILRLILRLAQRRARVLRQETAASLRSRLVPYFVITHATRGKVPGPFTKFPPGSPIRRLALDAMATLCGRGAGDAESLRQTVAEAVSGTTDEAYWNSVAGLMM